MQAVEIEVLNGGVDALACFANGISERGHAQDASAAGQHLILVGLRARMKRNHARRECIALERQAMNRVTFAGRVRVACGGENNAQRHLRVPLGAYLIESAVDPCLQEIHQVGLQARHDRLRLRVAQPAVEFEGFDLPLGINHQPGIQKSCVGDSIGSHPTNRWENDFAQRPLMHLGRHDRSGRVRAHAARVGALIPVAQTLVVLTGRQCEDMFAVGHDDEAGFFAGQK